MVMALVAPAPAQAGGVTHVHKVALAAPAPGNAEIAVSTSAAPKFSARVTNGGTRLLVDITDADVMTRPSSRATTWCRAS